jgi:hypothetical protein
MTGSRSGSIGQATKSLITASRERAPTSGKSVPSVNRGHDGQSQGVAHRPRLPARLQSIHHWHVHVHRDQVAVDASGHLHGLRTDCGNLDHQPRIFQQPLRQTSIEFVTLGDQDTGPGVTLLQAAFSQMTCCRSRAGLFVQSGFVA